MRRRFQTLLAALGAVLATVVGSSSLPVIARAATATKVTVTLTPSAIVADGQSKTVAAAAVTDAAGHPVSGQAVSFSSTDPGQPGSIPASQTSPGTYTATITSTRTVGASTITATDTTAGISGRATLTQAVGTGIHIMLTLTPSTIVADGQSMTTAVATIIDAEGHSVSGDSVAFSASDAGVRLAPVTSGNGTYTAVLTSSTTAGAVAVAATDLSTGVSTGAVLTQVHGTASVLTIALSQPIVVANGISTTTATITVADGHGNAISNDPVTVSVSGNGVGAGPVLDFGSGVHTVVLTSSNVPTAVTVTATDAVPSPPVSASTTLAEVPAPSLVDLARMQWSFYYTPRYTVVQALALKGPLGGSMITIRCHGRGCPFGTRNAPLAASRHCVRRGRQRRCSTTVNFDVARDFRGRRLSAGAVVVINVLRPGWIGKYYAFRIRSGRGPQSQISCLPPGGGTPGTGCQT